MRFDSPSAAAEAAFDRLERLRDFSDSCDHHRALVRKEVERLEALASKLEKELRRLEDAYYAENDPNYRDSDITKRFNQTKQQLDDARKELADARDAEKKIKSQ